jgi:hypothetical protein
MHYFYGLGGKNAREGLQRRVVRVADSAVKYTAMISYR